MARNVAQSKWQFIVELILLLVKWLGNQSVWLVSAPLLTVGLASKGPKILIHSFDVAIFQDLLVVHHIFIWNLYVLN